MATDTYIAPKSHIDNQELRVPLPTVSRANVFQITQKWFCSSKTKSVLIPNLGFMDDCSLAHHNYVHELVEAVPYHECCKELSHLVGLPTSGS